jgi:CheY-like chemotaxis protein
MNGLLKLWQDCILSLSFVLCKTKPLQSWTKVHNTLQVARMIRQQADISHAKLIAVTGYGTKQDKRKALDAGFDHHLVKPARLQNLLDIIAATPRLFMK